MYVVILHLQPLHKRHPKLLTRSSPSVPYLISGCDQTQYLIENLGIKTPTVADYLKGSPVIHESQKSPSQRLHKLSEDMKNYWSYRSFCIVWDLNETHFSTICQIYQKIYRIYYSHRIHYPYFTSKSIFKKVPIDILRF